MSVLGAMSAMSYEDARRLLVPLGDALHFTVLVCKRPEEVKWDRLAGFEFADLDDGWTVAVFSDGRWEVTFPVDERDEKRGYGRAPAAMGKEPDAEAAKVRVLKVYEALRGTKLR